ncbi:MAG: alpha/beta fold hydrolase [Woeseiaceae bacterium]
MSTFSHPQMMTRLPAVSLTCILMTLTGCITPAERYQQAADGLGLTYTVALGQTFDHQVWRNQNRKQSDATLHVYIEGDGSPWVAGVPSADPAPRQPVALKMMAADPTDAVLVGRPCYHRNTARNCSPKQWTSRRYSKATVDSMAHVINALRVEGAYRSVVLVGYSGGGVLATLLARRIDTVDAVVTIGANLDTTAWTNHHGYSELTASVNPAELPRQPSRSPEVHYIGRNDSVVPANTRKQYFDRHPDALERIMDDFGHVCCWTERWPELLDDALRTAAQNR